MGADVKSSALYSGNYGTCIVKYKDIVLKYIMFKYGIKKYRPVASLPGGGVVRWRPKRGRSRVGWCVCVCGGGEGITIVSGPGVGVGGGGRSNPPNPPWLWA